MCACDVLSCLSGELLVMNEIIQGSVVDKRTKNRNFQNQPLEWFEEKELVKGNEERSNK